ncbi:MAG: hypothetical protein J6Z14_11195 [Prevotella sp.]|nr:hypothetical protein [Prevotella sp.]
MVKIVKKKGSSILKKIEKPRSVNDIERTANFKLSFQDLDTTQKFGSAFLDWQRAGLLSLAMETLRGFCCLPMRQQIDGDKFAIYDSFPPEGRTMYEYPKNVPEDAHWARIHVNGPAVIIGHIVNDTFYVVFLDKTHKFWLTEKDRQRLKR